MNFVILLKMIQLEDYIKRKWPMLPLVNNTVFKEGVKYVFYSFWEKWCVCLLKNLDIVEGKKS